MTDDVDTRFPGSGPFNRERLARSLLVQAIVLGIFLFLGPLPLADQTLQLPVLMMLAAALFMASNWASSGIVGWVKDYWLWPRAGAHPDDPEVSLREWWKGKTLNSRLSGALGFTERIVVVFAGLISIESYFLACLAWLTLKSAIEWRQFAMTQYRVISHIYLIAATLSLMLAAFDVVLIRYLFDLPLIAAADEASGAAG